MCFCVRVCVQDLRFILALSLGNMTYGQEALCLPHKVARDGVVHVPAPKPVKLHGTGP